LADYLWLTTHVLTQPEGLLGIQNLKTIITCQNWVYNGSNIIAFMDSQWKIKAFRPLNHSNLNIFDQDMKKMWTRKVLGLKSLFFNYPFRVALKCHFQCHPKRVI